MNDLVQSAVRVDSVNSAAALPEGVEAVMLELLDDSVALELKRHSSIRGVFHMGNSCLTDEGVEALASLPKLEALCLEWSAALTDESLVSLSSATALSYLDISFCFGFSSRAVSNLRRALPGCDIET